MKEILKIINLSYSYDNKFTDLIINFFKKLEEKKINESLKEISLLIENILNKKKEKDSFKSLISKLSSLNEDQTFKQIKEILEKIIKKEIKNSDNKNQKVLFLKLIIPIKTLDIIQIDENLKKNIELIDIPGLKIGINRNKNFLNNNQFENLIQNSEQEFLNNKQFENLIQYSSGFLFVIKKNSTGENSTKEIIYRTIYKIRNRNKIFSFNNLFFVLTHCENSLNKNMETKKKDIKNSINLYDIIVNQNIIDENEFSFSEFSNKKYEQYLKDSNQNNLKNSNFSEFKEKLLNLIKSSKNSLEESKKKGIINFIRFLTRKLNIIHFPNYLKEIDLENIKKIYEDMIETIKTEIDNFKKKFEENINKLSNDIKEEEMENFSSTWNINKNELDNKIKNIIKQKYSKIDEIKKIKDTDYEKNKYFSKNHIIAHGVGLTAQAGAEGAIVAFSTISISFPPIAIAVSTFFVIHGGICFFKFIRDKIYKKEDKMNHIKIYKDAFIDNLNSYKNDIKNFLERRKDLEFREINDRKISNSLNLNDEERKKFNFIYSSFKEKLNSFFNLEYY